MRQTYCLHQFANVEILLQELETALQDALLLLDTTIAKQGRLAEAADVVEEEILYDRRVAGFEKCPSHDDVNEIDDVVSREFAFAHLGIDFCKLFSIFMRGLVNNFTLVWNFFAS